MKSRSLWVGLFGGIVATALVGVFAVPALGLFEMTATGQPGFLDWWGDTNWHSSLEWRAPKATIPASADPERGLAHYKSSCLQCHGAPQTARAEWAHRMQPMPPRLWEQETQHMTDGELFHVVRGGVRMTGMPAFGPEHNDADIWNIVAFLRQLNDLSDKQEQELATAGERLQHTHQHYANGQGGGHHAATSQGKSESGRGTGHRTESKQHKHPE